MTITAKFAGHCATCHESIHIGDEIEYKKGEPVSHAACAKHYYEIAAGGDKIGILAHSFTEAKAEAERLVAEGCDAEYCEGYGGSTEESTCHKKHYHTINCRCPDCVANDLDDDY
jgi:hypothetical protein